MPPEKTKFSLELGGSNHEAALLAFPARVIAHQKRGEVLAANVAFILVDFHGDIAVANDVWPRLWKANRFWFGEDESEEDSEFVWFQCDNTATTSQSFRHKSLIYMVPTEGVEPTHS
jgi:hypothetical protein